MGRHAELEAKKDPSKGKWVISIPPKLSPTGRRKREYFSRKSDADDRAGEIRRLQERSADLVKKAGSELIKDAVNFDEIFRDIYGFEGGLKEACEEWMKRLDKEQQAASLKNLWDAYVRDHQGNWGKSSKTRWKTIESFLKPLMDKPVFMLEAAFWIDWLGEMAKERDWSDQTVNDVTGSLSSIWKHGVRQRLVASNPIDGIKRRRIARSHKAVYEVDEVSRLMACAWEHDRDLVPYFAIAVFAGLRPESEISRLRWEDINFEEKWIRVGTNFDNKTGTRRYVPIEENLLEWLKPWRNERGSVVPSNLRNRKRWLLRGKYQAPKDTPPEKWKSLVPCGQETRDISRHTYGSYLDAKVCDRNVVKENMGHTNFTTYEQHYRNARSPQEAERFWNIRPPSDGG